MRILTVQEVCIELAKLERRGKPYHKTNIMKLIKRGALKTVNPFKPWQVHESDLLEYHKKKSSKRRPDLRVLRHFSGY
jgi:hypothetical protein